MGDGVSRGFLLSGVAILAALTLGYVAYSRPWYFTSQTNLAVILGLELLIVAIWMYRIVFFWVVVLSFLFAGSNLQIVTGWTTIRWGVLATGAVVGLLIVLKEGRLRFRAFDLIALIALLATLISATVSLYPQVVLLKVVSMLLLFVYAGTGARIAATEREGRFVLGLLTGCEIFVGAMAISYAVRFEAMGNANSLGAVMGAVCAPVILWGALLGGRPWVRRRRMILYTVCLILAFMSGARAAIGTVFVSSAFLLLALRQYKRLIGGAMAMAMVVSAFSLYKPYAVQSAASSFMYKGGTESILLSRASPWQVAVNNISEHPWFGMGLGTTASGNPSAEGQSLVTSTTVVTTENGSSYLALLSGVGIIGALPFGVVLIVVIVKILRTWSWMRTTGSAFHPAVPLAILIFAGLLHAAFEDWMFAAGNYLCVLFWVSVFIFADVTPEASVSVSARQIWQLRH